MMFSLKLVYADLRGHCFLISPMCIYVHARISNVGVHDRDILKIPLVNAASRQCKSVELLSICRQFGSFGEFSGLMSTMSKIYCLLSTLMFGRLSLISSRMLSSYVISLSPYVNPSQLTYLFLFLLLQLHLFHRGFEVCRKRILYSFSNIIRYIK